MSVCHEEFFCNYLLLSSLFEASPVHGKIYLLIIESSATASATTFSHTSSPSNSSVYFLF